MPIFDRIFNFRLKSFLLIAIVSIVFIAFISPNQLGVVVYKISLVTLAAFAGYHLDRALFPYSSPGSYLVNTSEKQKEIDEWGNKIHVEYPIIAGYELVFAAVIIRRALVVAAIILGVSLGL